MDFTNNIQKIDNLKGNYILIILNDKSINYKDILKCGSFNGGYDTFGINIITFDTIYSGDTVIDILKQNDMVRDRDYILLEKIYRSKIIPSLLD